MRASPKKTGRADGGAVPRRRSTCAWPLPTSATPRRRSPCGSAGRSWRSANSGCVGHLALGEHRRARSTPRASIAPRKALQVDVFGASLVRSLTDEFDKSGNGNRFAGAYATTTKLMPKASVEPYRLLAPRREPAQRARRRRRLCADDDRACAWPASCRRGSTTASRWRCSAARSADDSVSAWAGHWQLRESLPGRRRGEADREFNFASGDENPTDGTRGTFDQLYPTGTTSTGSPIRSAGEHPPLREGVRVHAVQGARRSR